MTKFSTFVRSIPALNDYNLEEVLHSSTTLGSILTKVDGYTMADMRMAAGYLFSQNIQLDHRSSCSGDRSSPLTVAIDKIDLTDAERKKLNMYIAFFRKLLEVE